MDTDYIKYIYIYIYLLFTYLGDDKIIAFNVMIERTCIEIC